MARTTHTPGPGRSALTQAVKSLDGAVGRVGWFESAKYEDGTPVAGVAAVQEYGNAHIPPRLGLRETQANKQGEWAQVAGQVSRAVVQGRIPPSAVMEAVCLKAEGDARETITKVLSPPLKQATIRARQRRSASGEASTKPLVDSGLLLGTLTSQTETK